jgi:ABC-type dipeptide/oligopeptide/nickel transport system permease component
LYAERSAAGAGAAINLSVDCVYAFIDPRIRYVR